jgi:hypothetical protein
MSQSEPHFSDGGVAIFDPYLAVLNFSPAKLLDYMSDSIDVEAVEQEFADSDGSPLGSDTRAGFEKGSISFQYNLASQAGVVLKPGFILALDKGQGMKYYVAGKPGTASTRNQMVKGSVAAKRSYNPILTDLLSSDLGQGKSLTQAAGALSGDRSAARVAVNTRSGSTLAYSLAAIPGGSIPGWLSINASTGALSGTSVAGTFVVDIVVTETLSGQPDRIGVGRLTLVIT